MAADWAWQKNIETILPARRATGPAGDLMWLEKCKVDGSEWHHDGKPSNGLTVEEV